MIKENRPWLPAGVRKFFESEFKKIESFSSDDYESSIHSLIRENVEIHDRLCVNLDPATNTMNPAAEKVLASGLGSRPSLGYPGEKYETGLEAVEKIEVMASHLVKKVFGCDFVEMRVASGAISNLYAFMATTKPGDTIMVPPPEIGGHVTHQAAGAAGLYGLKIHHLPVDKKNYTVDAERLSKEISAIKPKLITIGGSLNLNHHPVSRLREIADKHGSKLLFDAAHLCGAIAGKAWPDPLTEGAHIMTCSTYKSLGGPASGLIMTNTPEIAQRLEAIAFPGMTANFDVAKSAAMALTMLDWLEFGKDYAAMMLKTAASLAEELTKRGIPAYKSGGVHTRSHQLAIEAAKWGGGQTLAGKLRKANLLTCGIGLPIDPVEGDMNGLRLGTPEMVRWGMTDKHTPELAELFVRVMIKGENPESVAPDVSKFRQSLNSHCFIRK